MSAKSEAANLITGVRILCSIALLFCQPFSPPFIVLYLIAGITDMTDGAMARRTNTTSEFGAKLDTAADFVFVAVCLWKLLPSLAVPLWLWIWIVLIALIKMVNIISGYVIQKKYVALHTVMNKVTVTMVMKETCNKAVFAMKVKMILLVIRHGESEADILDVHEGRADFELTQKGHRQAAAMAKYVAGNYRVTRIYASTLKRAAQTARYLSDETGTTIEFDPDLMEFNNGLLAGLSHEDADRLYPHVENLPIDQAVYGQESKVEFRSRAENALQRVLSENGSESVIAIVTHGGMVNQLYGALLHMPIGENCFFRTADTGIHIWEITERGSYVIKANMDDHIRGI